MMSDRSTESLQTRSNLELKKIDAWLCQNKLSLNYPKTNFMVINKYPHKSISASFNLNLNGIALKRVETIKYLGISINKTLIWTSNIAQSALQLFKYACLFYRLHSSVVRETLCRLYYTLVYSDIQYGIIVWTTANKTSLGVVKVKFIWRFSLFFKVLN